jgi:dihydrofolate reductase
MSLDGFISPLDGSTAWLSSSSGGEEYANFVAGIGGIIMGRRGYETELTFGAWGYGHLPVVVVTRGTIAGLPEGVELAGNPMSALMVLKANMRKGDIWLYGGGTVAGSFLDEELIDRVEVTMLPVVLGTGRSLFSGAHGIHKLQLLEHRTESGVITNTFGRV